MSRGPLFWTPTIEGLFNYEYIRDNPEHLDDPSWHDGLPPGHRRDIKRSIAASRAAAYFQRHAGASSDARREVQAAARGGRHAAHRHRQRHPDEVPQLSTWRELDAWVNLLGVDPMTAIRAATYWPSVAMKVESRRRQSTPTSSR